MRLDLYDVISKPLITEKSNMLTANRQYSFNVSKFASKPIIAKAVSEIFGVKVKAVRVLNVQGKIKRFRGKIGKRADVKKAIVTLETGFEIDFAGGVK